MKQKIIYSLLFIAFINIAYAKNKAVPNVSYVNGITINYGTKLKYKDLNTRGRVSKIQYVQDLINKLLEKDRATGGKIIAELTRRNPHLVCFNKLKALESKYGDRFFNNFPNSQDLQADEIFPSANKNSGYDLRSGKRDASVEEIVHLIHNYGITLVYPKWQKKLDLLTEEALEKERFNWYPGHELSREDLDDEYLAASVEAFYNLKTEGGYLKDKGATSGVLNRADLERIDPKMYKLIAQIFPDSIDLGY